jgi:hypothetical protein
MQSAYLLDGLALIVQANMGRIIDAITFESTFYDSFWKGKLGKSNLLDAFYRNSILRNYWPAFLLAPT